MAISLEFSFLFEATIYKALGLIFESRKFHFWKLNKFGDLDERSLRSSFQTQIYFFPIMSSKPSSSTSTSSWSKLKDPRIVRVARAIGGKDRHSKVCTVRGLRDRRVRLSVPTAIQLYDLQERLGLNQPSKVVDWLLNAAKNEINELPPLQIPQGFTFTNPNLGSDKETLNNLLGQNKDDHENWTRNEEENQVCNNTMYNSFVRRGPSNLTLGFHGSTNMAQNDDFDHNFSLVQLPASHQVLVYQPTQSYYPSSSQVSEFETKLQPDFRSSHLSISSLNLENKHNEFHSGQP